MGFLNARRRFRRNVQKDIGQRRSGSGAFRLDGSGGDRASRFPGQDDCRQARRLRRPEPLDDIQRVPACGQRDGYVALLAEGFDLTAEDMIEARPPVVPACTS